MSATTDQKSNLHLLLVAIETLKRSVVVVVVIGAPIKTATLWWWRHFLCKRMQGEPMNINIQSNTFQFTYRMRVPCREGHWRPVMECWWRQLDGHKNAPQSTSFRTFLSSTSSVQSLSSCFQCVWTDTSAVVAEFAVSSLMGNSAAKTKICKICVARSSQFKNQNMPGSTSLSRGLAELVCLLWTQCEHWKNLMPTYSFKNFWRHWQCKPEFFQFWLILKQKSGGNNFKLCQLWHLITLWTSKKGK